MPFKHMFVGHTHIQIIRAARTQLCALIYEMGVSVVMESLFSQLSSVYWVPVNVIIYNLLRFA